MKRVSIFLGLVFVMNILTLTNITNAQNLIDLANGVGSGSFELGEFADQNYVILSKDSTVIKGWTVETESVDWVKYSYWNAADGNYSIDLNGDFVSGCIYTTVPTVRGEKYNVSFDISGFVADGSSTNPKSVEVWVGNIYNEIYSLSVQTVGSTKPINITWNRRSFEFIATDS
ncbi:conserved hypothetical protein, secreted [Candidatus Magnetomorum sp. HK-1]|nr:conserved hypothetical protein, secreted [Candidatus Magnetomorum sp. HK-1]